MQIQRRAKRTGVDIPIEVMTVLDRQNAAIADLSEFGAQIVGCGGLAPGARFQIEYMGQTVYAQCRWSEIDRMGVQFLFQLSEGPLFERLLIARATHGDQDYPAGSQYAMTGRPGPAGARGFGRGGFGRRG